MAKILVVEDDRAINGLVCSCLKSEGYETTACYDGEEGLNAFVEGAYSLIISDIMMPKMDGFEFAEEVRARNKQIPILFMTAKDDKPSKLYSNETEEKQLYLLRRCIVFHHHIHCRSDRDFVL